MVGSDFKTHCHSLCAWIASNEVYKTRDCSIIRYIKQVIGR